MKNRIIRNGVVVFCSICMIVCISGITHVAVSEELEQPTSGLVNGGLHPGPSQPQPTPDMGTSVPDQLEETALKSLQTIQKVQHTILNDVNLQRLDALAINELTVRDDVNYHINRMRVTDPDRYNILKVGPPESLDSP